VCQLSHDGTPGYPTPAHSLLVAHKQPSIPNRSRALQPSTSPIAEQLGLVHNVPARTPAATPALLSVPVIGIHSGITIGNIFPSSAKALEFEITAHPAAAAANALHLPAISAPRAAKIIFGAPGCPQSITGISAIFWKGVSSVHFFGAFAIPLSVDRRSRHHATFKPGVPFPELNESLAQHSVAPRMPSFRRFMVSVSGRPWKCYG